jgi:hypothetical protein
MQNTHPISSFSRAQRYLDMVWLAALAAGLLSVVFYARSSPFCEIVGTDFRGYYAAAEIAWKHGFKSVYDPSQQAAAQAGLAHHCPDGSTAPALIDVYVPYLPVFLLLLLPLPGLDFTTSYYAWSLLNLAAMGVYLYRFTRALNLSPGVRRGLQWMICLPSLANLALGQVNVFLVICMGEFVLAMIKKREIRAGLWMAALLIKPHALILLVPGLALGRRWRTLVGFGVGSLAVFAGSIGLAGWQGVRDSLSLAAQFGGALIQTGPAMINWRALALNLTGFLPDWAAWGIAASGMAAVSAGVLCLWVKARLAADARFLLLMAATVSGTFTVSWHAHFYMLMLLIPLLAALDAARRVPAGLKAAWIFAPPLVFFVGYGCHAPAARNVLGLSYLALSLALLLWSARALGEDQRSCQNGREFI